MEMRGVRLFRSTPSDAPAGLRSLLSEITGSQFSGIAACLGREGIGRLTAFAPDGLLYRREGAWVSMDTGARLVTYEVRDQDDVMHSDIALSAVIWDRRGQRRVMFADLFRPARRGAVRALLCEKIRTHPSPLARTLACPDFADFNVQAFGAHCLQPDRLNHLRLWLTIVGPPDQPGLGGSLAIELRAAEFIDDLAPAWADAFAAEVPGTCPPAI
jgi:hypothetical protein